MCVSLGTWAWAWMTPVATAAEPTVGAIVRPEVAVDLAGDFRTETAAELNVWTRAFARGEVPRGDAWFFELRMQNHVQVPSKLTGGFDLGQTEAWWDLGVGETGWDGKIAGPARLRIGALVERWGRLDLLPVNDVINPREGRSGLLVPGEWQRIPLPMATLSLASGRARSETTLIPFSSGDRTWLREQDWSYIRQGWIDGYLGDATRWVDADGNPNSEWNAFVTNLRSSLLELPPSLRRGLDEAVNDKGLPEAIAANGEIAERVEVQANSVDIALMAGYLRSRQPESNLDPALVELMQNETALPSLEISEQLQPALAGGPLDVVWPRTFVGGVDGSVLAGPIQIRAESMFQSARVVRLPYAQSTTRGQLGAGLGIDYVRGSSFQFTLESRWLHLFDPPPAMIFSLPDQVQIAGGVRWALINERLTLQLGGAYDLTYSEYLARPTVSWRFGDGLIGEVGALVLGGAPPPTSLVEALNYDGGPLSYFGQNDAVTVAFTFVR